MSRLLLPLNNLSLVLLDDWPQICEQITCKEGPAEKTDGFFSEAALRGEGCLQNCETGLSLKEGVRGMKEEVTSHSG